MTSTLVLSFLEWKEKKKFDYLFKSSKDLKIEDVDSDIWMSPYANRKTVYGIDKIPIYYEQNRIPHYEFKPWQNISIVPKQTTVSDVPAPSSIFLLLFFILYRSLRFFNDAVLTRG